MRTDLEHEPATKVHAADFLRAIGEAEREHAERKRSEKDDQCGEERPSDRESIRCFFAHIVVEEKGKEERGGNGV